MENDRIWIPPPNVSGTSTKVKKRKRTSGWNKLFQNTEGTSYSFEPKIETGEIALLGLDQSGKTVLMHMLNEDGILESTFPTIGLNVKMIKPKAFFNSLKVWDFGGQQRFRGEWARYIQGCDIVLYCVDASDPSRLAEAKKELYHIYCGDYYNYQNTSYSEKFPGIDLIPVLIVLTKNDLPCVRMTEQEVAHGLELSRLEDEILKGGRFKLDIVSVRPGGSLAELWNKLYRMMRSSRDGLGMKRNTEGGCQIS